MSFHAIRCGINGSLDDYRFTYDLGHPGQPTAAEARDAALTELGHDDFLIGEVADGALVELTDSDPKPLIDWSSDDYREVAAGVGLEWSPRSGVAATGPAPGERGGPA